MYHWYDIDTSKRETALNKVFHAVITWATLMSRAAFVSSFCEPYKSSRIWPLGQPSISHVCSNANLPLFAPWRPSLLCCALLEIDTIPRWVDPFNQWCMGFWNMPHYFKPITATYLLHCDFVTDLVVQLTRWPVSNGASRFHCDWAWLTFKCQPFNCHV